MHDYTVTAEVNYMTVTNYCTTARDAARIVNRLTAIGATNVRINGEPVADTSSADL